MIKFDFIDLKNGIQMISLVFSIFFNSILIYLILTKSPKKLGTYKHLMCYFSAFSMVYAILDFVVKPYIHSYGASFSMIMDLREDIFDPTVAFFCVASLAGCFGVTIYAIAINFIFRYFALERKGRLRYFNGKYLAIWFFVPLFGGISWVLISRTCLYPDPEFTEYLRENIREDYDLDADHITYSGSFYYRSDGNGDVKWSIPNTLGALGLNIIMVIPFLVIVIMGWKSYEIVTNLILQGESEYTKKLQLQLYKALVAQTIIPMVFLFFPIGILFSAPLFQVNIEKGSVLVTFFYSLYPLIDPIPIIFFIDSYRNSFLNVFKRSSQNSAKVYTETNVVDNVS